ncbi:MAG: PHP domain-containing protein, partial [Myxococcales bacterium]|nr:PHP domain-containing protein [Myxococcales bacterium]
GVEVSLANAVRVRLWWATAATVGAALLWHTGSPRHRAQLCELAERRGLTLSAAGLFDAGGALLRADDETAMLEALGLPPIPAVLREGRGELEVAEGLPSLIEAADLRGDLHMHSRDSDGRETVAEMAARARALGLDYIAITDHSRALTVAGGLDELRLLDQAARIRALPQGDGEPRVLAGIEVDILRDGSLDLDPSVLAGLDWVVASVHQWTRMSRAEMTARVIRAIESGVVDCIGHPTGRRPGRRDAYELDLDAVIEAAVAHDVALECNGGPNRMDLDDEACARCREAGVAVAVNTDAHAANQLGRSEYGLAMAQRGWLQREHVLNVRPWPEIAERRARRLRDRKPAKEPRKWVSAPSLPDGFVLEAEEQDQPGHAWES